MDRSISTAAIKAALVAEMPTRKSVSPRLAAAIREAAAVPGQLVRGRMIATGALNHRASAEIARQLAVAIEYFHLASLIMDDLPCMDNADYRRGRPCLHHQFDEPTALLAAMAFTNRAYSLLTQALANEPAGVRRAAQACLESVCGEHGLVGGQARDLAFRSGRTDARAVGRIALEKTGALFRLAVVLPALLDQPSHEELKLLYALSVYLGLAYQTADDLQDVSGDQAHTGKTTGRDHALGRPNLALVLGPAATRARLDRYERLAGRTLHRLVSISGRWDYLRELLTITQAAARRRNERHALNTAA